MICTHLPEWRTASRSVHARLLLPYSIAPNTVRMPLFGRIRFFSIHTNNYHKLFCKSNAVDTSCRCVGAHNIVGAANEALCCYTAARGRGPQLDRCLQFTAAIRLVLLALSNQVDDNWQALTSPLLKPVLPTAVGCTAARWTDTRRQSGSFQTHSCI